MIKTTIETKTSGKFFWIDYSKNDIWKSWLLKLAPDKIDIYHEPEYARLYTSDDHNANCYVYAKDDEIYLYPFIMRPIPRHPEYFDIISPYGYGGPVSNSEDPVFLNEAYLNFYKEALSRNIIAEVIKFHPLMKNHLLFERIYKGGIVKMRSTVYVDVNIDETYRWEKIYTHANRKNINKAKRKDARVEFGKRDVVWNIFESLYAETMRANNVDKFYFFPKEYFNRIRTNLSDKYILVSCEVKDKIVSVMLVLLGPIYAYCHLIGTDREFMGSGANNLLHHELILWCKTKGYRALHIGGGRTDSDDDLLFKFKKNFSDKTADFFVGENVLNRDIYDTVCGEWHERYTGREIMNRLLKYRIK